MVCVAGKWQYPRNYTGAFILGNLLLSVLVRNEAVARLLYTCINYFFAKVRLLEFLCTFSIFTVNY